MERQLIGFVPLALGLLVGLAAGTVATWFVLKARIEEARHDAGSESQIEMARLGERLSAASKELERAREVVAELRASTADCQSQLNAARSECAQLAERADRIPSLEAQVNSLQERRDQLVQEQRVLVAKVAELTTSLVKEQEHGDEKLALLKDAKDELSATFESLANKVLEDKTIRFADQNKRNISEILDPLKTKIDEFRSRIDQVHSEEMSERGALGERVRQLTTLNQQLSQDAKDLTRALIENHII